MKRLVTMLLAFCLLLSTCACSGTSGTDSQSSGSAQESSESAQNSSETSSPEGCAVSIENYVENE